MMLPDAERARVERSEVVEYLLSASHPDGHSKAAFFMRFGFRVEAWQLLAEALRATGTSYPVTSVVEGARGKRYTVDGPIQAPDGRAPTIRTVWIVADGAPPRLITAYPL